MANNSIKVGVVGGTGYTGVELLRLLSVHPNVNLQAVTSRSEAGTPVADMFPSLRGYVALNFSTREESDRERITRYDHVCVEAGAER